MAKGWLASDIPAHAEILQNTLHTGRWLPHPGLHVIAWALLGFSSGPNWKSLIIVFTGITFAAILAKHFLTLVCLSSWRMVLAGSSSQSPTETTNQPPQEWIPALLTMCLCLAGPIWSPEIGWSNFYIGKFSPDLWHNPTLILAWPIIILHFVGSIYYFHNPRSGTLYLVLICQALATIIKPNYTIALAPALPLSLLVTTFRSRAWIKAVIAQLVVAVVILLPQWFVLHGGKSSAIGWAPLAVVSQRSSCIPLTFLASIAFPLITVIVLRKRILAQPAFQLAGLLFAVAAAQAYLFVEHSTSTAILDGNWFWGAHATLFLLFLITLAIVYDVTRNEGPNRLAISTCWGAFGLHVISGMGWLIKYFLYGSYF
ncbi:MAG: hypothetical protein ACUVQG_09600 [Thermogutta sp.]